MKSKIYFASDCHLGVPDKKSSFAREKRFISWLDEIKTDASELYLLGDIFDFWFEYRSVVPRGYVRLLGKLAELSDSGIKIHYFTGNHDMWVFDYFTEEMNIEIHKEPIVKEFNGKRFFIGHGDGLGPKDYGYKFIKAVFASKINQWLFARLHPNFAFGIAKFFSGRSRIANGNTDEIFLGEEKERLILFCKEKLTHEHFDYFIFGHRHLPLDINLNNSSRYINIGEWIKSDSYAVFENENLNLKYYK
ncbi:MAG: UDP-2,3-diacylglucosamine diphosphatase [Bacteroidota bacterium]